MQNEELVLAVARQVREVLLTAFPDRPNMERQCKRAAMLLDMAFQELDIEAQPLAGWVCPTTEADVAEIDTGHVWLIVWLSGVPYLLDVTLQQFQWLYPKDRDVPEIVWGPYDLTIDAFGYVEDGLGRWEYDGRFDIRADLVDDLRHRLQELAVSA